MIFKGKLKYERKRSGGGLHLLRVAFQIGNNKQVNRIIILGAWVRHYILLSCCKSEIM
jgi:hypothetical protein